MVLGIESEVLLELIRQHGVLAVMLGAVIEEVIVPVPSPVIPLAAGSLLIETNSLSSAMVQVFLIIALPASIASTVSTYFVYSLAYFGGEPSIKKYGRYLEVEWEEVEKLERHFGTEREKYLVFIFRALPIVPLSLISGAAGLFRMNWKEYGLWTFLGMLPRTFFLGLLGWYVKDDFMKLASRIDTLSTAVAVLFAGIILFWLVEKNTRKLYGKILFDN